MNQTIKTLVSLLVLAAATPFVSTAASADEQGLLDNGTTVSDKELDTYRGGSSESLLTNNMQALFQNNSCVSCVSGANNISDSFNNINGMTNVILNSGNNVVIQSSFQVNVNFGQ